MKLLLAKTEHQYFLLLENGGITDILLVYPRTVHGRIAAEVWAEALMVVHGWTMEVL